MPGDASGPAGGRGRLSVRFRRLAHAAGLPLPAAASGGSAGLDLRAAVEDREILEPGRRLLVPTGFAVELPPGHEGQVRPRSGLAARHGVTLVNSPGTVDGDYRGEILVALINLGDEPWVVRRGDRIAQMVVAPVATVTAVEASGLGATDRGEGGLGSTGRD